MNNIVAITLQWNKFIDTIEFVKSRFDKTGNNIDLLIIDNGSSNGAFNYLREFLVNNFELSKSDKFVDYSEPLAFDLFYNKETRIFLLRSNKNYGFAKGCNLGAFFAKAQKYHYLLFINNDTLLLENTVQNLYKEYVSNQVDIAIPQIRYASNPNVIWNCGGRFRIYGKPFYYNANRECSEVSNDICYINLITGCCFLIKCHDFFRFGMFTELFFFGEEDIDFSLRMVKIRSKMICVNSSVLLHKVGSSLSSDSSYKIRSAYLHYMNRIIHMKLRYFYPFWLVWVFVVILRAFLVIPSHYSISVKESMIFCKHLFRDVLKYDNVTKSVYDSIPY